MEKYEEYENRWKTNRQRTLRFKTGFTGVPGATGILCVTGSSVKSVVVGMDAEG